MSTKVFGSPGTGKTTYLMDVVLKELQGGLGIEDIAYMGFTRAACSEALSRASKIVEISEQKRYWFKTIHATCLHLLLGANLGDSRTVATWVHLKDFCTSQGLEPPNMNDESTISGGQISTGSAFFSTYNYLINTFRKPGQFKDCPQADVIKGLDYEVLHTNWNQYKYDKKLIDFADMLFEAHLYKLHPPMTVLIVDEFQDISPLQLQIIKQFAEKAERVYIAGDDDQALYGFQGADSKLMLDFETQEKVILDRSHRCPEEIWIPAMELIRQNKNREPKDVQSRGTGGRIIQVSSFNEVFYHISSDETTFLLARTNQLVGKIAWKMASKGVLFRHLDSQKEKLWGWTPKRIAVMNKVLRSPNRYRAFEAAAIANDWSSAVYSFMRYYLHSGHIDPMIRTSIGTIHSAKGREANNVVVFNDITRRVEDSMEDDPEAERRVWYVAMTRAKKKLVIVDGFFDTGATFDLL